MCDTDQMCDLYSFVNPYNFDCLKKLLSSCDVANVQKLSTELIQELLRKEIFDVGVERDGVDKCSGGSTNIKTQNHVNVYNEALEVLRHFLKNVFKDQWRREIYDRGFFSGTPSGDPVKGYAELKNQVDERLTGGERSQGQLTHYEEQGGFASVAATGQALHRDLDYVVTPTTIITEAPCGPTTTIEETWATDWLKRRFKKSPGASIQEREVYRMYRAARKPEDPCLSYGQLICRLKIEFGADVRSMMREVRGVALLPWLEGIKRKINIFGARGDKVAPTVPSAGIQPLTTATLPTVLTSQVMTESDVKEDIRVGSNDEKYSRFIDGLVSTDAVIVEIPNSETETGITPKHMGVERSLSVTGASSPTEPIFNQYLENVITPNTLIIKAPSGSTIPSEETWAIDWLKKRFKLSRGASIEQRKVYKMYFAARNDTNLCLNTEQLVSCIKRVFETNVRIITKNVRGEGLLPSFEGIKPKIIIFGAYEDLVPLTVHAAKQPPPQVALVSQPATTALPIVLPLQVVTKSGGPGQHTMMDKSKELVSRFIDSLVTSYPVVVNTPDRETEPAIDHDDVFVGSRSYLTATCSSTSTDVGSDKVGSSLCSQNSQPTDMFYKFCDLCKIYISKRQGWHAHAVTDKHIRNIAKSGSENHTVSGESYTLRQCNVCKRIFRNKKVYEAHVLRDDCVTKRITSDKLNILGQLLEQSKVAREYTKKKRSEKELDSDIKRYIKEGKRRQAMDKRNKYQQMWRSKRKAKINKAN